MLLPKVLAFYRALRSPRTTPKPLSAATSQALNLIFISATVALLSTLPFFAPTNLFDATQSRLQAPTGVLFNRLSILRLLTPVDDRLRSVFEEGGLEARLLYLRFGPSVIADCPFNDPKAHDASLVYLFYALPSLLAPHLLHLAILGLVTSALLAGRDAARWRTPAVIAGLALAFLDVYGTATYEHQHNARATRLGEVDFFFWKKRVVRGIAIAAVDGVLGWAIYLSSTNRAFIQPPPAAERLEGATKKLEAVLGKLRGLGSIRNVVFRDAGMRAKVERYWVQEAEVMRSVLEEREVVGASNEVLSRTNVESLGREAEGYVEGVLGGVRVVET
ncbi:hypothetical protein M8818_002174 [Zalaria obscura]|uniref:Uncharacterized protein n=1 Tax=Zalaria obscura TaxID=2024903 RepID=A0ACC3SJ41_9PEZI